MRAILMDKPGGVETLEVREVADPEPGPGQVRVRVAGCGVNHLDLWIRDGLPGSGPWPHILGAEVSGTIDKLGSNVAGVEVGKPVLVMPGKGCGRCEYCHSCRENICPFFQVLGNQRQGGYAEFVVVDAGDCVPVPIDRVSLVDWAAVPLVFQTAWHMLFGLGKLQAGETVMIESAGSGVGTAALQVAKLAGARVIVTAGGEEKRLRLEGMGVDLAIDHQTQEVRKLVKAWTGGRGVDLVFAHVGGEALTESLACLARGGRLVTCGATAGPLVTIDLRFFFTRELSLTGAYLGTRADLDAVVRQVSLGRLQPVVDRVYPLADVQSAHRRVTNRDLFGKLVLSPSEG
ncbi:MAG: zinc-binding dehydrogenase [Isosphaeraceae bacterium]